jgi:hypothetical protein
MTFLTIYTPTFRRPRQLERCKASVAAQSEGGYEQLVIVDDVGLGVAGMFRDIPEHHADIHGDYVYFLSDDDVLADEHIVRDLKAFVAANPDADVIMARATIGPNTYPYFWEAPPLQGAVTLSNWIVKRDVWLHVPYGGRYEGDFDHVAECWRRGLKFAWWDRIICNAEGWGRGQPEQDWAAAHA